MRAGLLLLLAAVVALVGLAGPLAAADPVGVTVCSPSLPSCARACYDLGTPGSCVAVQLPV